MSTLSSPSVVKEKTHAASIKGKSMEDGENINAKHKTRKISVERKNMHTYTSTLRSNT
jgi:hypothetical protein